MTGCSRFDCGELIGLARPTGLNFLLGFCLDVAVLKDPSLGDTFGTITMFVDSLMPAIEFTLFICYYALAFGSCFVSNVFACGLGNFKTS